MPFVAVGEGQKTFDITDFNSPKLALANVDLRCPYCDSLFTIVSTKKVTDHFRHRDRCTNAIAHGYFSGETEAHRLGKRFVRDMVRSEMSVYTSSPVRLEVSTDGCSRISDVMLEFPFGYSQAFEVQFSQVDPSNIAERTQSYTDSGIDVIWFLGPACRDPRIISFLQSRLGYYFYIDETDEKTIFKISTVHAWNFAGDLRIYVNELYDGYQYLWLHLMRLAIARYLQVYRFGFSPDFALAIEGNARAESMFGSNMRSMKEMGVVKADSQIYRVPGNRWPIKFWRLVSPELAGQWLRYHHQKPLTHSAILGVKSRSKHTTLLPGGVSV